MRAREVKKSDEVRARSAPPLPSGDSAASNTSTGSASSSASTSSSAAPGGSWLSAAAISRAAALASNGRVYVAPLGEDGEVMDEADAGMDDGDTPPVLGPQRPAAYDDYTPPSGANSPAHDDERGASAEEAAADANRRARDDSAGGGESSSGRGASADGDDGDDDDERIGDEDRDPAAPAAAHNAALMVCECAHIFANALCRPVYIFDFSLPFRCLVYLCHRLSSSHKPNTFLSLLTGLPQL